MSSLSSVFNSCSTLITLDIYKKYVPKASEAQLVKVGQVAVVILVIFGLLWTQFIKLFSEELFQYIQKVQAYISPPIAAVFLLGIFVRRLNKSGAIYSLWSGFILGGLRFALEPFKDSLSGILHTYASINFLHFAIFLFVVCSAILVVVSLLTPKPDEEKIKDITYDPGQSITAGLLTSGNFILSIILLVIVLGLWLTLSDLVF